MSEVWTKWQGHVVNGVFPLHRYLGGSDNSGVFLTELRGREPAEVAIKLVPAHPTFAELLLARWNYAADLAHPHLMRLLDGGECEIGGLPHVFLVMEYADQHLAQLLAHRALTEDEAREMLLPVLDALAFLHNRNLVQGQLKPANILVVGDQIRLASDTIRPVSEVYSSTNIASVYDPPEVQDGSFSTAGDIWGLGVTLFEALTRSPPLALNGGRGGAALPPEFSPTFRDVVTWCLSRRPYDRPKVAELEAKIRGQSTGSVRSIAASQFAELSPLTDPAASTEPTSVASVAQAPTATAGAGVVPAAAVEAPSAGSTPSGDALPAAAVAAARSVTGQLPSSEPQASSPGPVFSAEAATAAGVVPTARVQVPAESPLPAATEVFFTEAPIARPVASSVKVPPPIRPAPAARVASSARSARPVSPGEAAPTATAALAARTTPAAEATRPARPAIAAGSALSTTAAPVTRATPASDDSRLTRPAPVAGSTPAAPTVRATPSMEPARPASPASAGSPRMSAASVPGSTPSPSAALRAALAVPQPNRPAPPSVDTSKRIPRESPVPRPTVSPSIPTRTPAAGVPTHLVAGLQKPNTEPTTSDLAVDPYGEYPPKRPPYALILAAAAMLILGWAGMRVLDAHRKPTPEVVQTPPPPPQRIASESTLVRDVPKPLVVASASNTKPKQAESTHSPAGVHEEIPDVPQRARRSIHGHVRVSVRLIVDQNGSVYAALVEDPGPSKYFERIAIEAAKKWTFPPLDSRESRLELVRFDFTGAGTTGEVVTLR
jgi:TonB family protein